MFNFTVEKSEAILEIKESIFGRNLNLTVLRDQLNYRETTTDCVNSLVDKIIESQPRCALPFKTNGDNEPLILQIL